MWTGFDVIQTYKLKQIFLAELNERLSTQAMEDRVSFDRYVKAHLSSVKLFISQRKFSEYADKQKWKKEALARETYKHPPGWFPESSVLRSFIHTRFAHYLYL